MYRNPEIPSSPASRIKCGPGAAATVLLSAVLLSGCATFSPDGGMTVVANLAGETIHKEVVSIRTEDDAQRANASVQGLLRRVLTVDTATKNFTVRKVGAVSEPGKSYELWLISDKLQGKPRSLGLIGNSDFTVRPALAAYDTDTINKATYAVTVEQEGGSPTGAPTSAPVFTGKLVESVPALPASNR